MTFLKKAISLIMALCLIFTFAACDEKEPSSSSGNKVTTAKWNKNLSAPGDVFEAPDVKREGDKAPIIADLTKQVYPGSSFTVAGSGFTSDTKAYIYAQNEKGNGKIYESNCTVLEDTSIMITVDKDIKYGVYGVYAQNSSGKSNLEFINRPKIWWNSFTAVNAGDEFSVYGENLTTKNGDESHIYLVDDKDRYCELEVTFADPYKVSARIPKGLEDGKEYTVKLHNGHGGEQAFVAAPEKIKFKSEKINQFNGKKIDVTEFGANPADDKKDDSVAIQKAVDSAADGDIIYFPAGVYLCDKPITPSVSLKFQGEKDTKVKMILGSNIEANQGIFNIKFGPVEITALGFQDIRKTKFKGSFIFFNGDQYPSENYNLYVHDCTFAQQTAESQLSTVPCISAIDMYGVKVENNRFKATTLLWTSKAKKVFLNNNDYCATAYCGYQYQPNAARIWGTDMMDASYNNFYGMDKLKDDSGVLNRGDMTSGRIFAVQQSGRNFYIANNKSERNGLPGDNAGEQIMLEHIPNEYRGGIKSATADTFTLEKNIMLEVTCIATIVKGKGISQWRYISKVNGKEITVSEPWDIIPDETSQIMITRGFDNIVIHNNLFDCFVNHPDAASATCAVQLYGTTHNCFITKNTMKNMPYGVCVTSHFYDDNMWENRERYKNGIYWTQIEDNKMEAVSIGIKFVLARAPKGSGPVLMRTSFGVTIKGNEFKDIVDFKVSSKKNGLGGAGITVGSADYEYNLNQASNEIWLGDWEYGTLIENNNFINNEKANIMLYKHQGGTVLHNNTVDSKHKLYTVDPKGSEPIIMK